MLPRHLISLGLAVTLVACTGTVSVSQSESSVRTAVAAALGESATQEDLRRALEAAGAGGLSMCWVVSVAQDELARQLGLQALEGTLSEDRVQRVRNVLATLRDFFGCNADGGLSLDGGLVTSDARMTADVRITTDARVTSDARITADARMTSDATAPDGRTTSDAAQSDAASDASSSSTATECEIVPNRVLDLTDRFAQTAEYRWCGTCPGSIWGEPTGGWRATRTTQGYDVAMTQGGSYIDGCQWSHQSRASFRVPTNEAPVFVSGTTATSDDDPGGSWPGYNCPSGCYYSTQGCYRPTTSSQTENITRATVDFGRLRTNGRDCAVLRMYRGTSEWRSVVFSR